MKKLILSISAFLLLNVLNAQVKSVTQMTDAMEILKPNNNYLLIILKLKTALILYTMH